MRPIFLTALMFLILSCGKENESGKSSTHTVPEIGNPVSIPSTPYTYQNVNVQEVLNQNPCVNGYAGISGMTQPYTNQRTQIQVQLTGFKTVVSPGDIFVGVTSYGDVAVVSGQAAGQPPLFVGYLCPRSFTQAGTGQLMNVEVGANTPTCLFKPITAATIVFPGGATADFRWLDGGNSMRQKFVPPVCL
jgi:hypothetical protein